jgi:tetratricopeptide (TPR) repeat protein
MKTRLILLLLIFTGYNSYSQCAYDYYVNALDKSKSRDYKDAIRDYTKVLEMSPQHTQAYVERGYCKIQLGKDKSAIADFNKAIMISPDDADAFYYRGLAHIKLEQKTNGCLDLNKAQELGNLEAFLSITSNCN